MAPKLGLLLIAMSCLLPVSGFGADAELMTLHNNPFSQPAVVNTPPPPPPVAPVVVLPPEEIELELSATMVSETSPMVVVDGELLAIGDKIEGMKLIAVMEGKAIFSRAGKKFSFTIDDSRGK
jgi:hypothetical protein